MWPYTLHAPDNDDSKLWQTAGEHTQKYGPNLQTRERSQTWYLALPLESKRKTVNTWPSVLQDQEKAYNLNNSSTKENKKYKTDMSIEGLRKPYNT